MKYLRSYKDFKREKYINERIEEIIHAICRNDIEYKKYTDNCITVTHLLQEVVPPEHQDMILKYEDILYSKFERVLDLLIRQVIKEVGNFKNE